MLGIFFFSWSGIIVRKLYTTRRVQNPLSGYAFDGHQKWTSWLKGAMSPSRGYYWEFLVGVCRPVLQILTLFQKKKCHFPHPFSDLVSKIHTRFQTWKRVTKRNITCLHKTEIMSSLLRLKPPQKDFFNAISNSHITLSFLIMWN